MTAPRWPLHPQPRPGEALSSWLERIAAAHGMTLEALGRLNLGMSGLGAGGIHDNIGLDLLDVDPPAEVLATVHERSGLPLAHVRSMTAAGLTPWLMDSLDPDLPDAFTTYVRQDSVIFGPGEVTEQQTGPWRPWISVVQRPRLRRACLQCQRLPDAGTLLMANLPVMLSCPAHGARLMPVGQVMISVILGEGDEEVTEASGPVAIMDRRTHEGVTTGVVSLPRRTVHVGVWFRLLRTVLDEVNAPISRLRREVAKRALILIWKTADRPQRAGQSRWRPYEELDWKWQSAMLEAAAVAMHLAETGAITARGTLGELLHPEPDVPVLSRAPQRDPWEAFLRDAHAVIEAARSDPVAALQLLRLFTNRCHSPASYERSRRDLINFGLREDFLPRWLPDGDRPLLDDNMT
jgi:hypothetical protein